MDDELATLFHRIHALPDEQLLALLEQEADQYTPMAISIAELEAETRGGVLHLRQQQALIRPEHAEKKRPLGEDLVSKLRGRPISEKYPGLSYIAMAMRLLSFLVVLLGGAHAVGSLYNFLAGNSAWWWGTVGWIMPLLAFLVFFGGSELIHVLLDIEKNTREGRSSSQHDSGPSDGSA